jgi:hypothetical protein
VPAVAGIKINSAAAVLATILHLATLWKGLLTEVPLLKPANLLV